MFGTQFQVSPMFPAFVQVSPEPGIEIRRILPDGRIGDLQRMLFTWRLSVGPAGVMYYEDGWCYETRERAIAALLEWDGEGEPEGWHRHPSSGRRREHGDPAKEHVYP